MRIAIDLQACQCENRFRGIGHYSMSLAQAMTRQAIKRGHDVRLVLSEKFPETVPAMRQAFDGLIPQECISVFSVPGAVAEMVPANAWRARAAELVREQYLASLNPDVIHVASLFDGWLDDAVTSIHASEAGTQTAVTLYDLIPFVLSDIYLADPGYREYYFRKLKSLKRSDLLLAISEHSRKEAIELLGVEPSRIINISAAVDETFRPRSYSGKDRQHLLEKYKITKPFILYVPGGFDPRKNFDRLIEAFVQLPGDLRQHYQLVIASKVPEGVRKDFANKAARLGLEADELLLTGYMPDDDLIAMYCLCKLYVFPSLHEGFGLPALEAMACGAPVVSSNTTSLPEVIGREDALFDPTSVGSIAAMLHKGLTDEDFERSLREHAPVQAKKFSWDSSAKLVIDAFELQFAQTRLKNVGIIALPQSIEQCSRNVLAALEEKNYTYAPDDGDLDLLAHAISMNQSRTTDKQLLVDISELVNRDAKSGIQRVVRSILLQLLKRPPPGYRIEPVYSETGNGLRYAHHFKARFMEEGKSVGDDSPINFGKGDIFVGLDLTAHLFPAMTPTLQQMRESGVRIHYVIYDLTPLLHTQWHGPGMTAAFMGWMDSLGQVADSLVCISAAVADDVKQWLEQHPSKRTEQIQVSHFHLGADINNSLPTTGLPENADLILAKLAANPSFLMVGTVEPRKGYAQALAAFEELWAAGSAVNLVVVGKGGWNVDALIAQLSSHPELGKRLYWLEGISDEYLEKIYQASTALLAASEAEGFGLPLIEAAQHKLPIIARRIPVFIEVAGEHAFWFDGVGGRALAHSLRAWLELYRQDAVPKSTDMPWLSWEQSANQLLHQLDVET